MLSGIRSSVHRAWLWAYLITSLLLGATALAQAPATGNVRGRVFNAASHEYIRNAEIRVVGTSIVAYSEDAGNFTLTGLPAGPATIVANYAGLQEAQAVVTVMPGQVAICNFTLEEFSSAGESAKDDKVIQLEKFEVAGTRSGQAKAIMERRVALNAKNVVASDNYGDLTMGDVGEFMKSMPGISLDYVEVDTNAVRVGGLDPKYSIFTTDGVRMPTGTSNNNTGRQNSFEQMSITGIEAIEFNNTLTASMDADAPGGSINLRSKYAFQRKGREINFQFGGIGTSDAKLEREYFPDDRKHSRIFPSGQIGYSDVLLDGRLGLAFTASYNANFVEQDRLQMDWVYPANTPAGVTLDQGGIPYRAMWRPGPKMTHREALNFSADYKLTDKMTFSLRSTYSDYDVEYVNQYTFLYFGSTSVSNAAPGSNPTHIVGAGTTNTRVGTEYSHRFADTPVLLIAPKLEYQGDTFKATLRGSYANARYNFRDNPKGFFQRDDSAITNLGGFVLERPSDNPTAWTLTQTGVTATNDWKNPDNWKSFGANNVRNSDSDTTNEMYSGYVDVEKQVTVGGLPVKLLAGAGARSNSWDSNEGGYRAYTFIGPTGVQSQAVIPHTQKYRFEIAGFDAGNFNDQNWRADSNYGTYDLFREHPEYFLKNDAGNLQRRLANTKGLKESIPAAYLEAQTRYKRARFDLGIRYESTSTDAKIWDVRPAKDVIAAGYKVIGTAAQVAADPAHYVAATTGSPAAGFASTPEGILYQYNNGKQGTRHGNYDNWFASGGVKYDFTRKLVGQIAFSDAILRPDYGNVAGATTVNESTSMVTVPNPRLKPENSTKYYAGLQYYFEPSGIVGLSFYRLRLKDMQVTGQTIDDPESVGYRPSDYPGYTFVSTQNDPHVRYTNGLTFEYSQQLSFLPGALKGLGLYGSVTRVIADGIRVGTPNRVANWGFKYRYRRFHVQVNGTWQGTYRLSALSNTPTTANNGVLYHAPRELWGVSAGYKLTEHLELMLSGRNIFNAPDYVYSNIPSHMQQYSIYGSLWTAGIKGSF